eukprot:m.185123 g.185123  ORF g.185123 m.185123 type:complete len:278 (-) comp16911_c0_seq35:3355-4188(-)
MYQQPFIAGFIVGAGLVILLCYLSQSASHPPLSSELQLLSTPASPPKQDRSPIASFSATSKEPSSIIVQNRRITAGQSDSCRTYGKSRSPTDQELREVVVLAPDSRAASFFISRRLQHYSSTYTYRIVMLEDSGIGDRVLGFLDWACRLHPGPKVILYSLNRTPPFTLAFWPARTALIVVNDERGKFGLYTPEYGFSGPFGGNATSRKRSSQYFQAAPQGPYYPIVFPAALKPWLRQYMNPRHQSAFSADDLLYWPLGSRLEFPDLHNVTLKPASQR